MYSIQWLSMHVYIHVYIVCAIKACTLTMQIQVNLLCTDDWYMYVLKFIH